MYLTSGLELAMAPSLPPSLVGMGFTSGVVCVLDALTLTDVCEPFRYARDCVTHIAFSHDSHYMATAVSPPWA